jgi:hypothetical protein
MAARGSAALSGCHGLSPALGPLVEVRCEGGHGAAACVRGRDSPARSVRGCVPDPVWRWTGPYGQIRAQPLLWRSWYSNVLVASFFGFRMAGHAQFPPPLDGSSPGPGSGPR